MPELIYPEEEFVSDGSAYLELEHSFAIGKDRLLLVEMPNDAGFPVSAIPRAGGRSAIEFRSVQSGGLAVTEGGAVIWATASGIYRAGPEGLSRLYESAARGHWIGTSGEQLVWFAADGSLLVGDAAGSATRTFATGVKTPKSPEVAGRGVFFVDDAYRNLARFDLDSLELTGPLTPQGCRPAWTVRGRELYFNCAGTRTIRHQPF